MDLQQGTVFYIQQNNQYSVYQVLDFSNENYYLKSFWPVVKLPELNDLVVLDIRAACTLLPLSDLVDFVVLGKRELSDLDLDEIKQFKTIQEAKLVRQEEFKKGLKHAEQLLKAEKFQEAIDLLTVLAPYNKLELYTYELRGKAFIGLGLFQDARYDFQYILSQDSSRSAIEHLLNSIQSK